LQNPLLKNNSIILIQPSSRVIGKEDNLFAYESLTPSLGLAMIAAVCRAKGFGVSVVDMRLKHWTLPNLIKKIKEEPPVCVGISAFTNEIVQAGVIAKAIKEIFPRLPVIIGGPHASIMPKLTLEEFPDFDLAVIGEGEEVLAKLLPLLQQSAWDDIRVLPGVALRLKGEIKVNEPVNEIEELDQLPFPAWDLFELSHYNRWLVIGCSRGCPYRCYFCTPGYLGRRVRSKSPQRIVDEIEHVAKNFSITSIQFADAMLTLHKEQTVKMCDEIISRGLHKKIRWECETRADAVDIELLKKMKQAGCRWVALGVETGNEEILKHVVKKQESKREIEEAARLARKAGLKVRCFYILGHYKETSETILETIQFAISMNPDALSFGLIVPNPGSEIRSLAERGEGGLRLLNSRWMNYNQLNYDCLESAALPLHELKKWQSRAYFSFYSRHPVRALATVFSRSVYNYKISGLVMIAKKHFSRLFRPSAKAR
jgi:anaerobic magnesium-protoporphyrin IX monomethyl ester cyclase